MSFSFSATAEDRAKTYRTLIRRNRLIGLMRIGVPVVGALVLAVLVIQIVIANAGRNFDFGGVRIVRDNVVIDTPAYEGVMANGTKYTIVAEAAQSALSGPDIVALHKARIDLARPDGYSLQAEAEDATFKLIEQVVEVEQKTLVTDSRGMRAQLFNAFIDWPSQKLVARDNVHAVFKDGSVLTAGALTYDAGAETWDFSSVKLTIPAEAAR